MVLGGLKMVLNISGKGKDYINGKLIIPNGKYTFNGIITIGDNGIISMGEGTWRKI